MIIPIVAGAAAVAFLGGIAFVVTRPNEFRVVREGHIKAAPEVVFGLVSDLRKWDDWSPWAKLDPNCKLTYAEVEKGEGASYQWNGNNKVGEGKLSIVKSRAVSELGMRLEFIRPFKCENDVDFTFKAEQGGTRVVWGMNGKNNLMSKAMCLVMNMDKMVGKDFEKGLTSLKALAEGGAN